MDYNICYKELYKKQHVYISKLKRARNIISLYQSFLELMPDMSKYHILNSSSIIFVDEWKIQWSLNWNKINISLYQEINNDYKLIFHCQDTSPYVFNMNETNPDLLFSHKSEFVQFLEDNSKYIVLLQTIIQNYMKNKKYTYLIMDSLHKIKQKNKTLTYKKWTFKKNKEQCSLFHEENPIFQDIDKVKIRNIHNSYILRKLKHVLVSKRE